MRKILLLVAIAFLFLVPLAQAGVTFTSISYDDTTADVGTSRTISVVMRTTSSSESATITDISLFGGLTEVSAPEKPFTVTYSGVTKTYVVRSDTAGTYSFAVTVVDSSGNSYSSSSDLGYKTLEYVNPSSLTLTSMEYPSGTYYASGTFGIVIRLQNSLGTTQTRNLTLWFDTSGFTVSGDPQSQAVSLASGQTEKIWNVTVGSSVADGTHYAYIRLGDNTQSASYSFTKSTAAAGTTTGAASSEVSAAAAAKTKVTVQRGKATITIPSIAASKMANVTITKTEDLSFREINITVKNSVNNIEIKITKLAGKPAAVAHEITGKVYHYIELEKNFSDSDISKVKIRFAVSKSWLSDNNIDSNTIALNRYTTEWNKLPTTKLSEDSEEIIYEAESPGLSYFAITGETKAAAPVQQCPTCPQPSAWSDCVDGKQTRTAYRCSAETNYVCQSFAETNDCAMPPAVPSNKTIIIAAGLLVIILAAAAYLFYNKRKKIRL